MKKPYTTPELTVLPYTSMECVADDEKIVSGNGETVSNSTFKGVDIEE